MSKPSPCPTAQRRNVALTDTREVDIASPAFVTAEILILKGTETPSERTTNPRLALKSLSFFPDVTRECYHSVQGIGSCLVHREII
jgi:hypothetical protein